MNITTGVTHARARARVYYIITVWHVTHRINATATKLTSRRAAVIKRHIVSVPVETNFARSTFSCSSTRRKYAMVGRERKELNRTPWTGKGDRGFPRWNFSRKSGRRPVWKMDNWFSSRIRTILLTLQGYLQIIIWPPSITNDYYIGIVFFFFFYSVRNHIVEAHVFSCFKGTSARLWHSFAFKRIYQSIRAPISPSVGAITDSSLFI